MIQAIIFVTFGAGFAGWFGWRLYQGFRTGQMPTKNSYVPRAGNPILFGIASAINAFFVAMGLVFVWHGLSR